MSVDLSVDRWFRFAATAEEAERLDDELDDDVLLVSTAFDLRDLTEDELLLGLPLVPRHETCPHPLIPIDGLDELSPGSTSEPLAPGLEPRRSPFAGLASDWRDAQTQRRKKPDGTDD